MPFIHRREVLRRGAAALTYSLVLPVLNTERLLGVHVTTGEKVDYGTEFARMKSRGLAQVETLALNWSDIESAPGKFKGDALAIANAFYPAQKTPLLLILRPIDTNRRPIPIDLRTTTFGEPAMRTRFRALLDFVFAQIPAVTLAGLAIGNEVDAYLGTNPAKYAAYRTFLEEAAAYARSKRPGLKVGVTAQLDGLTKTASSLLKDLNRKSDVIFANYYPLNPDFTVKPASVVASDWATLTARYPSTPIFFPEIGYPSSPVCGSSEEKQADFIRATFKAWDTCPQVSGMVFSWLTDLSPESVSLFQSYYRTSSRAFAAYLGSLGLRTYVGTGQDKAAFTVLQTEAARRYRAVSPK